MKSEESILFFATPGIREMRLNPLTLSFPEELESKFLEHYFRKSLPLFRLSLVLAIFVWVIFGILDAFLVPEMKARLWTIRYAGICPGLFGLMLLSFHKNFKKFMQPVFALMMFLTGLGIIYMIIIAPPPITFSYYAGLIIVFIFGYTLMQARFIWASAAGWAIVMFYEVAAMSTTPVTMFINNNFFFITANIIGMFACYSIEFYARRDFFLARLLEQEQEKVKAVNRELEQRVRERTAELQEKNKALLREMEERKKAEQELMHTHKMEAIGTLAGGIAHDFNNILTGIMGYSEIGLHKKNIDQSRIKYCFQQIIQASSRAKDLIRQILTFSRHQEQERIAVSMSSLVKETLKLMKATQPKNITISYEIHTAKDMILADPTQVHQVLMNLCTNAVHAMSGKGGALDVIVDDIFFGNGNGDHAGCLQSGTYIRVSVKDTGTGMDEATRQRIFDPFFSTKRPGEGTGLGLSAAHGIVKSNGGDIRVQSRPGHGSVFELLFPVLENAGTSAQEQSGPMPRGGSERLLFVDDERAVADIAFEMLEEFGYRVDTVTDPFEALERFRIDPSQFDLVITDKNMPGMTGFELAEEVFKIRPMVPVLLCSGASNEAEEMRAESMGLRAIIHKPFVMRDMAEMVRSALDNVNDPGGYHDTRFEKPH